MPEILEEKTTTSRTEEVQAEVAARTPASTVARWIDLLLPLIVAAILIIYCIVVSPKKDVWVDEAYSLSLVADRSLAHAMNALYHAADGGMPLYYALANPFARIFGSAPLTLRLFTSLNLIAALLVLWRVLRTRYSAVASAVSLLAIGINSGLLLFQDVELRYYGTYTLCAAIVLWAHTRLTPDALRKYTAIAWVSHFLLLYSHPFGVLYSAAALFGTMVSEYHRPRWKLYLFLASSWLTLLPWAPAFQRVQDLGRPHNWVGKPTLEMVWEVYSVPAVCAISVAAIILGLAFFRSANQNEAPAAAHSRMLVAQSAGFVIIPIVVALASWMMMPVFVSRYFLPSRLGMAVLVAGVIDAALRRVKFALVENIAVSLLLLALAAFPVYSAVNAPKDSRFRDAVKLFTSPVPVFVDDLNNFVPMDYYSNATLRPFYYVVDWPSALHSPSLHATVQAKLAARLREAHYHDDRIIDTREALCSWDQFIVFHTENMGWFNDHVETNRAFVVETAGGGLMDGTPVSVWRVTRIGIPEECTVR